MRTISILYGKLQHENVVQFNLALLRVWKALVYAAMNLRVPLITENFMTSRMTISIITESVLSKFEFSRQFSKNTDVRQTYDANSRFSQFCERA